MKKPGIGVTKVDFQNVNGGQLALGAYQTLEGLGFTAGAVAFTLGIGLETGGVAALCVAPASAAFMAYGLLELSHGPANIYNAVAPAISTQRIDF